MTNLKDKSQLVHPGWAAAREHGSGEYRAHSEGVETYDSPSRSSPKSDQTQSVEQPVVQKTACLACRKRKIRCDKLFPCTACNQSGIECGFMASTRTKSRSKVLQKLRRAPVEEQMRMNRQSTGSLQSTYALDTSLLSPRVVYQCTQTFFQKSYPINILFTPAQLEDMISGFETCPRKYAFVASVCAGAIYACTDSSVFKTDEGIVQSAADMSHRMIDACLYARSLFDYIGEPDLTVVLTSFFLGCAIFQSTAQEKKGWFYLREACTLMHMDGYHLEAYYRQANRHDEYLYRSRLFYFLMSISERGIALHRNRPITLEHSIHFPLMDNNDPVQRGFQILYELFAPFDSTFTFYRDTGQFMKHMVPDTYVLDLHRRVTVACPPYSFFASFHRPFPSAIVADLLITKQWLFLKIYDLTLRNALLPYAPQDGDLGLLYPIKIAKELIELLEHFDRDSIEPHGVSMFAKLYDISAALADLLSVVPITANTPVPLASTNRTTLGYGPQDLLQTLVKLVSQLSRARQEYMPRLLDKVQRCIAAEKNRPDITEPRQQFYDSVNFEFEDLFNLHMNPGNGLFASPNDELV